MSSYFPAQSFKEFQEVNRRVYGLVDDRLYSLPDLINHQQRFTGRAIKGIRKGNMQKLTTNLLISLSFLIAIANRLHLDVDSAVWARFPSLCSYCGKAPCACKKEKPITRPVLTPDVSLKPTSLTEYQKMFEKIYPANGRSLDHAGIHFAEEAAEISEALHNFLGEHHDGQLQKIIDEIADFISCVFGIANTAGIDIEKELNAMYAYGCHVCRGVPCRCDFSVIADVRT